jgi:DNA topoisomerase-1
MSKKYSTTTTLVIVESPAKCKKIEEYLGPGYKCLASFGHLRELLSLKNIDINNNFNPTYTVIENALKKKQVELLRKEIKSATQVILATDDDREGEAIAWHLCELFKLDVNKTKRITFNEITESALKEAIKNPRTIDMNIVHAQQARQILDILVGFKVSPIMWKLIKNNKENALSAGRCQTPALRLVYDNDKDIKNIDSKKVYNIVGYFTNLNLPFELNAKDSYESEDDVIEFLDGSADFNHIYNCSQPTKVYKAPPEPFTTSRIQQVASNELHYSPKDTMRICQTLYEGGFITYMRTDSKTYSGEFLDDVRQYIVTTYAEGVKYIGALIDSTCVEEIVVKRTKKSKKIEINNDVKAQEAHEAIRPTNISLCELPDTLDLGSKERRMYKLIWSNALESCMAPASYNQVTATINAYNDKRFVYSSELIDFPGWKIVTKSYNTDNKEYQYLQTIKKGSVIPYKKVYAKVTIKGLKHHYTEARLVQLLEEKGIGRPSTFASLIDKIQERCYIKKEDIKGKEIVCKDFELEDGEISEIETKREFGNEKGKLVIQPLGIIVMEFLEKHFDTLFEYKYTSGMESILDKIAKGEEVWYNLCSECNKQIDNIIENMSMEHKIEYKIDDNNTYIIGKFGPVIKHVEEVDGKEEVQFKPIKKDIDIKKLEKGEFTAEDIIDNNKIVKTHYTLGQWEGKDVYLKKGKFGLYITWGENSKTLKELGNRPIENITFDEVKAFLEEGSNLIRNINASASIRRGPKGDYLFYKTTRMKKPQFHDIKLFVTETKEDYKICDMNILKSWLKEKYNI